MLPDIKFTARNIVNQILDAAGTDVPTRQRINDECDTFAFRLIEALLTPQECVHVDPRHRCIVRFEHGCADATSRTKS